MASEVPPPDRRDHHLPDWLVVACVAAVIAAPFWLGFASLDGFGGGWDFGLPRWIEAFLLAASAFVGGATVIATWRSRQLTAAVDDLGDEVKLLQERLKKRDR